MVKPACYSMYLLTSYFCVPVPYYEKDIFFLVLVLEHELEPVPWEQVFYLLPGFLNFQLRQAGQLLLSPPAQIRKRRSPEVPQLAQGHEWGGTCSLIQGLAGPPPRPSELTSAFLRSLSTWRAWHGRILLPSRGYADHWRPELGAPGAGSSLNPWFWRPSVSSLLPSLPRPSRAWERCCSEKVKKENEFFFSFLRTKKMEQRAGLITPSFYLVCAPSGSVMSDSLWPSDCSPPGSSVHGTLQASIRKWVAIQPFPIPVDLPNPGIKLLSPSSPVLAGRFFTRFYFNCS